MHYRKVSCSNTYFQADHPENARGRQWIESYMKKKGIQSAVEFWLYVLRYYLDTSHSDIMRDAAELIEKYGEEGLQKMMTESHIPPDLENHDAYTYHTQADNYFFSIWEAAEGEEFILTHNTFGLWEGLGGGCPGLHRIFVVSPRIALVLRHVVLRPEMKEYIKPGSLVSSLLHVNPVPPTPIYASGERGAHIDHVDVQSAMSLARYRSSQEGADDSFVFKITKLSRPQTLEFNSVLLVNVTKTGSLTFLSRRSMLRTVRAFRSLPANFLESELLVPLIARLADTVETEVPQAPEILSTLFKEDTPTDGFVVDLTRLMYERSSPSDFSSGFHMAYSLRRVCGMAGPTTNPVSLSYYQLTASIIQCLGRTMLGSLPEPYSSQPRERPKARLLYKMPEEHSELLFSNMKMILRKSLPGYELSPGGSTLGQTLKKWIDEMAIVGCLAWLGKHRRNFLDYVLDGFLQSMNFKLFEDEEATGST
ncbi:uncharacterized protein F5147DRAFT_638901 [Suillus discolor]|uniref:Uncharacterized protein n=1 Tax=Suillus discolor TaxID=1912936 RepID=A0A9P7F1P6_9AGAM|nr:uncharacterized protein F5147DRAFT_638901 [Suillus discolor]KAG2103056.1 hypothetical protein F5147DRAFT_638901 [Suillus discolor]